MSSNLLLAKNNEKNVEEEEGSNEGGYTPPTLPTGKGPGVAPSEESEAPKTGEITRGPNGTVEANSYRARPNLDESPIVAEPNSRPNYQELPDGPDGPPATNTRPPAPAITAAAVTTNNQGSPAKKSAFQAAFTQRYGNPTPVAPSKGSGDATKKIIAIVVIGSLVAGAAVLYNQFPSYGNTIMSGFINAAMIFGGIMIVITAICIMMNVYKPDGFAITLFAGWLGLIGAWVIVPIYTVYHTFWPVEKRPYFGLFPAGFSFPGFDLIDMLLEPFHDGSGLKSYDAMLKKAHQVLYGSSV